MKRNLLLAALFAVPLYLRQRQVERRQRLRLRAHEARTDRSLLDFAEQVNKRGDRMVKEVNEEMTLGEQQWRRWGDRLVKEIERAGRP